MNRFILKLDDYKKAGDIFDIFYKENNAVFLDSSLENNMGNYSIIALNSYLNLTVIENDLYVNGKHSKLSFEEYLKKYIDENKDYNDTDLPIVSGAIGYLSYDYGRKNENISTRHKDDTNVPQCIFNFYDNFIIEDIKNKETYIIGNGVVEDSIKSVREIENKIKSYKDKFQINNSDYEIEVSANFEKDEYKNVEIGRAHV